MITKISIIIGFLLIICGISTADNYIIDGDTVYIDDSKVYLSANPHTLSSSGWVYFNLTSKVYTGNIDVCWGFNTSASKPTKAEVYSPHWINTTTNHEKTFYNPTHVVYTGDDLDYGNSYNTNYKYTVTEIINNDNGTTYITSNASFDSYITDGTNYTIYWYTRHDNYYLWKDFSSSFNSIIHDYKGYNKWYYIKNIPITSNKEYTVRAWIDVPISTEKQFGKYYFAIKPSHETISQAITNGHFYNLDPWWNTTWSNRKKITLTGNTSGAQTDYQLLLNVTYDSDMQSDFDDLRFCNETHKLDSWLESKVDGFYALVWVEFPTTPANTVEHTYYMYYGKVVANYWDGAATFIVFDGFEDALQGDWSTIAGTIDYSNTDHTFGGTQCMKVSASSRTEIPVTASDNIAIQYRLWKKDAAVFYFWHCDGSWSAHARIPADEDIDYYNGAWQDSGDNLVPDQWELIEFRDFNWTGHTYDIIHNSVSSQNDASMWNYIRHTDKVELQNDGGDISYIDNFIVRKYAANPPTYAFGSEEAVSYMPPNPISLMNTIGNFWINHTWSQGSSNVTNSYNISVNSVWHNTSPAYYNDTYAAHAWQNTTVWAYNSTGTGTLSSGSVGQDTQIPNNPITITNMSDWNGDAGENVYVDYDAIDVDSDTVTFSCNRMDLFTDFDTDTGRGNWTATANIYYVDFGVSDGYGSVSNYTMTLTESSVVVSLSDELKLIMSEITTELKSINMGNYLVYAFILIGILLIIFLIRILNNCIYGK